MSDKLKQNIQLTIIIAILSILTILIASDYLNRRDEFNSVSVSTVKTIEREPNSDLCDTVAYIDALDIESDYLITHAIMSAQGSEDTINVMLENCNLLPGYRQ